MSLKELSLAALLLAFSPLAYAQAPVHTWHGLVFGTPRDQVRSQLNSQSIRTEVSPEGSLNSTNDYDLFLPGLRSSLPMFTSYHFTDAGGLMDVTLTLDMPAMRRVWGNTISGDEALMHFATEHLAGALAGRYGASLYHSPGCDATPASSAPACAIFWNGPEQSILLERTGAHLFLRYQMLATDL